MKKILFPVILIFAISVFCICSFAAESTIYISASGNDTAIGNAAAPMKSFYAAFRALPYGGKIVVTDAITLESTEFPSSKGLVTVTSHDGTTDYRTTNNASISLGGSIYLKSAVSFEKLNFTVSADKINFVCNGNFAVFGEELEFSKSSDSYSYPNITAGALGLVPADGGYVEIHSGTYARVYGGAAGPNSAAHGGSTTLAVYGGTFNDAFYTAGVTELTGNTSIYIYGGTFNAGIVGAANADISGSLYITVYGGSFSSYIRPATNGELSGSCTVNLLGSNIKNVYGVDKGSVTGSVDIRLASGISLTACPYETSTVSQSEVAKISETDSKNLSDARGEKYPVYTENPLKTRASSYKGISPKAESFKKEIPGGDFDSDGVITLVDAMRAFKAAASGNYSAHADIDEDKKVSVVDFLTVLKEMLEGGEPITEYGVQNIISKNLIRYGDATVTDNTVNSGYIFGTTSEKVYTLYSNVTFDEGGIAGLYFGCSSSSPSTANGYYFEANTKDSTLTVYFIENSNYRKIADRKLDLLSDKAQIKVVYGKSSQENAVQLYLNDNPLIADNYFDFDLALDLKGTGVGLYVENAVATTPVVVPESVPESTATYKNFILSTFTDPDIYYENGTYYIYGTKSGGLSGVRCYSTADFVTFTDHGTVLDVADGFGDKSVTAANIVKHGDVYYMFYLQDSTSLGYATTGYTTSTSVTGPFKNDEKTPLTGETDLIGGQPFIDDDGKAYLVYTRTTGGNQTYISELHLADGKAELDLATETRLLSPSADWEYAKASVIECGFIVKHEGIYYLIYSGGNYNSTYGTGYATSENIYGPYTKYEHNPILWSNDQAYGNGAASVFPSPDGNEHFIIYLRNTAPTTARPLNTCIDRIRFVPNPKGGADILEIAGGSVTPQALPSGIGTAYGIDYQMSRWHW